MKEKHMDIQLRQTEIEKAIKLHLAAQGISLASKAVSISFSATRDKEKGIIAMVVIEDSNEVQIPGYTDRNADPVPEAPKATVHTLAEVKPNTIGAAIEAAPASEKATEVAPEAVEGVVTTDAAPASKPGLFND